MKARQLNTWKGQISNENGFCIFTAHKKELAVEQHLLDTHAGKTTVLSCHRRLINTIDEKVKNI